MGLEIECSLRVGRTDIKGRAHLAADRFEFRGGTRLDIPFSSVKAVNARPRGVLDITHSGGRTVLGLGDRATAEKWALKIRYPKSLIDKLGVKSDSCIVALGVNDPEFLAQAADRLGTPPKQKLTGRPDFIFYAADSVAELAQLKMLRQHLQPAGAIWVVSLKGKAAKIKDTDVMHAARAAGLVDIKVCGFSATHTALKLVVPKSAR